MTASEFGGLKRSGMPALTTFDQTFAKSLMGMNPVLKKFMGGS